MNQSSSPSADEMPKPPRLGSGPSGWLVAVALMGALASRFVAENSARAAARAAAAEAEARAVAERRERDSLAFAERIATAKVEVERSVVVGLDSEIHGSGFALEHSRIHDAAGAARIDSAVRLIVRWRGDPERLLAAESLLGAVAPMRLMDSQRVERVRSRLESVRRSLTAENAREADRRGVVGRVQGSEIPRGATARCRDGTYSFSRSRRGTCSHHGGVSEWL